MNKNEIESIKEGTILHESWGYDMTHNDFCVVLKVLPKSFVCQMIATNTIKGDAYAPGGAQVMANVAQKYGQPFYVRIYKREYQGSPYYWLSGSYPYCYAEIERGAEKPALRLGSWSLAGNRAYYENHLD